MKIQLPKHTANVISILRIFLTFFLWFLIITNQKELFFILTLLTYFSDILDGFIARTFKLESDLGRNLDTIGDILFFPTLVIGLVFFFSDFFVQNIELFIFAIFAKTYGYFTVFLKLKRLPTVHLRSAQTWGYWLLLFFILSFTSQPRIWLLWIIAIHALIFSGEYILFCLKLRTKDQENLHSYFALSKELQKKTS